MPKPPWDTPRGLGPVLEGWLASHVVKPCLAADEARAGEEARLAPIPATLPRSLEGALRRRGIDALYSHQAEAYAAATGGQARGVVVATPTASGKSLCFHLPVLQRLVEEPGARAMYLYPTKALSRDQEASVRALASDAGLSVGAVVYDGDTPQDARRAARERAGLVLTNPDMLHAGILPHHTSWARTFQSLRYVVVDELHTYRGVFGSHVANVLRRLLRVARFHGSDPVLIGATATIGNPRAHAARLFGLPEADVACVAESGAPKGPRRVFVYNPPVVNAELGIRASYVKQAVRLAADLARAHVPTIVFGQSRNSVEVMLRYLRDAVAKHGIEPHRIMAYRGGYLPDERRDIERRLRSGDILCVVSTSALELGIDVGELDAVICAGYPGSVAATWQRFGRAGRRGELSACILVTSSAPLDQYLARDPSYVLGAASEEARIDPDNTEILVQHLKCAAFELPFREGERFGALAREETDAALGFLETNQVLHRSGGAWHWAAPEAYPANAISLRLVGWDNVVIVDVERDKSIGELDYRAAHTMLHEQAIYQHDGATWQVERFDYENHKAFVRKVEPDYYTDAMTNTQVSVMEDFATGELVPGAPTAWPAGWGEVSVVERVVGYKKIKFYTHENAGYGEVRLPEMQMHTTAFWVTVPKEVLVSFPGGRARVVDGLRGLGIVLETSATIRLMCDPRDLGTTLADAVIDDEGGVGLRASGLRKQGGGEPEYAPTLFLYEHVPGGIGLSERIWEDRELLLARAQRMLDGCPCASGCPACVGPSDEAADFGGRKPATRGLLALLLPQALKAARAPGRTTIVPPRARAPSVEVRRRASALPLSARHLK